jgi:hypothetical protein
MGWQMYVRAALETFDGRVMGEVVRVRVDVGQIWSGQVLVAGSSQG